MCHLSTDRHKQWRNYIFFLLAEHEGLDSRLLRQLNKLSADMAAIKESLRNISNVER